MERLKISKQFDGSWNMRLLEPFSCFPSWEATLIERLIDEYLINSFQVKPTSRYD